MSQIPFNVNDNVIFSIIRHRIVISAAEHPYQLPKLGGLASEIYTK